MEDGIYEECGTFYGVREVSAHFPCHDPRHCALSMFWGVGIDLRADGE